MTRLAVAVGAGLAAAALLLLWRRFPLDHAAMVAIAVAALAYTAFSTVDRLKNLYRR